MNDYGAAADPEHRALGERHRRREERGSWAAARDSERYSRLATLSLQQQAEYSNRTAVPGTQLGTEE
eukprot:9382147-Heterocapsa_arctica.AAC.1